MDRIQRADLEGTGIEDLVTTGLSAPWGIALDVAGEWIYWTVGRKNHYGCRSKRGTEVAALFYSLIESAKLCGVEPRGYLRRALHAALVTPGTVTAPARTARLKLAADRRRTTRRDGEARVLRLIE